MALLKSVYKTKEEIPEAYQELFTERQGQWLITQIEGVKTEADTTRLQTALTAERAAHDAAKEKLRAWGDYTPEDVQTKLDKLAELEAAGGGKLDEEKISSIAEARVKSRVAAIEREKAKLAEQLAKADKQITAFTQRERQRKIHDAVRAAAAESKMAEGAVEDALLLAERVFDVDDDGKVTVKDQVGFTPGSEPAAWLSEVQPKRAHWWPPSVGGGARGNNGGGGFANNPWSADHWNLTAQGQIVTENAQKAEQMAKAAGSFVGATRPKAKAA